MVFKVFTFSLPPPPPLVPKKQKHRAGTYCLSANFIQRLLFANLLGTYKVLCFFFSLEMKMSALTQIPRGHFYVLSKEAIKLFNVSKAEVGKAIRLGLKLLPRSTILPGSKNSMESSLGFRIDSLKNTNSVRGR